MHLNKISIKFFPILILLIAVSYLSADSIEMHDGANMKTDSLTYDGREFTTSEKSKIPLEKVKTITIKTEEAKAEVNNRVPDDVKELLQSAIVAEKLFPDSKLIVLMDYGKDEMTLEKTFRNTYEYAAKILDIKKNSFSTMTLGYNEERTKIKILLARSIDPDGTVYNYDTDSIKISEPTREAGHFGKGKILTYTIPGIKEGSIVHIIHQWEEFNPSDPELFFPSWSFASEDPFVDSRIEISIPRSKKLYYLSMNIPPEFEKPREIYGKETVSYIWQLKNQPAVVKEPKMPPVGDVVPRIRCSLFEDFTYIKELASKRLLSRMQPTPEIENFVKDLIKNIKTEENKIAILYHYVQQNIEYISIKGSIASGLCGHPAAETFANKYGDCIDVAILFSTMLKIIDVEAYPVWVYTNHSGTRPTKITTFGGNHAITQIYSGDKAFFLDCTATHYRFPAFRWDDHGVIALNPILGTLVEVPVPAPSLEADNYRMDIVLLENGDAQVKQIFTATGSTEAGYRRFFDRQAEDRKVKYQQSLINHYSPGAKFIEYSTKNAKDLSKPFEWYCQFVLPDYITTAGNIGIMKAPGLNYEFPEVALEKRKYDIYYSTVTQTTHRVSFVLPNSYKVKYIPEEIHINSPYCSYDAKYTVRDNTITFEDKYSLLKRIVPVENYTEYRENCRKIAAYSRQRIFLEITTQPEKK
ncbi:MAG: DUF3857 and transglutaminase domain-containing protein [Planctomycetota bacterium]